MLRFFDLPITKWKNLNGCLHLYALPDPEAPIRADFNQMARPLNNIPGLGRQPEEYMHVTLQRFDAFIDDLDSEHWQVFLRFLPQILETQKAFDIEFSSPTAQTHAVEAVGSATPEWSELVASLRRLATESGISASLTPPPSAPHYTLAYCTAPTSDQVVDATLAPHARSTTLTIRRVALVAVNQNPVAGTFSYQTVWQGFLADTLSSQLPAGDDIPRKEPVR